MKMIKHQITGIKFWSESRCSKTGVVLNCGIQFGDVKVLVNKARQSDVGSAEMGVNMPRRGPTNESG